MASYLITYNSEHSACIREEAAEFISDGEERST